MTDSEIETNRRTSAADVEKGVPNDVPTMAAQGVGKVKGRGLTEGDEGRELDRF